MIRTAILGASGYVGGELLRLLAAHPQLRAHEAVRRQQGGRRVGGRASAPRAGLIQVSIEKFDDGALADVDLVFAALPHGHSQNIAARSSIAASRSSTSAPTSASTTRRPTSAGTAMRTRRRTCSASSSTAFPSSTGRRSATRRRSPPPGCYATAAILALKPLVDAGLVKPDSLIVDAASGVSGAGGERRKRPPSARSTAALRAYGLLNHRHTAEMEMALGATGAVHARTSRR